MAEYLIEGLTTSDATVLDPMLGSGTILTAANKIGSKAVGFDRVPLALLITRSAAQPSNSIDLENLRDRVLERAKQPIY